MHEPHQSISSFRTNDITNFKMNTSNLHTKSKLIAMNLSISAIAYIYIYIYIYIIMMEKLD